MVLILVLLIGRKLFEKSWFGHQGFFRTQTGIKALYVAILYRVVSWVSTSLHFKMILHWSCAMKVWSVLHLGTQS